MKDKVIEIGNQDNIYVIEELDYQNKKYILGAKCDLEKDEVQKDELVLMEVSFKDGELVVKDVDDEMAVTVTELIQQKMRANINMVI